MDLPSSVPMTNFEIPNYIHIIKSLTSFEKIIFSISASLGGCVFWSKHYKGPSTNYVVSEGGGDNPRDDLLSKTYLK